MLEIALSVVIFTFFILALSALLLFARSRLVATGNVDIVVNDERTLQVPAGGKLITALSGAGLYLPAGCGGKGTCGQCRLKVFEGGGPLLPTEAAQINRREAAEHVRLACQVSVRESLRVRIPEEVFGVRQWQCRLRSNHNVATFIKEVVLELPPGEDVPFKAGGYVQVLCPPYQTSFSDFEIDPVYRDEWDRHGLWDLQAGTDEATTRAYSMANYPGEKGLIILNVRIATPPPGAGKRIRPGVVSSYLFGLKPGDPVTIAGPYGEFFARETDKEMVFIGGGAGMAPLRSLIFDQLERLASKRKISFWYGARSRREMFYTEELERLAAAHENFDWTVALSEPQEEDSWTGATGFIHELVYERYLAEHPAPEDCEYYLCGPPLMIAATREMLEGLGVEPDNILFDDFGG